ncbi:MAG: deoxyribodipyrimidine photolyase [Dehalococcoidia bacterium SG8_51_3]|nr:MAG: deoxyribodipyrimidine photolyase [Dehalococcoidia bacterium SG8_51_3]
MIQEERIKALNRHSPRKRDYVLYWMQASQRTECNHALEYAVMQANERKEPLVVYFGLTDTYPEANERHYSFMLQGLKEVRLSLKDRGIAMVVRHDSPERGAVELARRASIAVCDRGYLRIQKQWRQYAAEHIECPLLQVESDVVVPVEAASEKEEYSAATLRRKLHRILPIYLKPMEERDALIDSSRSLFDSYDITDSSGAISGLTIDRSVKPVHGFRGGIREAKVQLEDFINRKLDSYVSSRNDPNADNLSNLSPYLHFGQISPLYIALKIIKTGSPSIDAFLEELLVRRELSMNFVHYNPRYDSFDGLPEWAKRTLSEHRHDYRAFEYSLEELERAKTHDSYWNAAQKEMAITGKMHGYMRMYWGKKILEWSARPEEADRRALYLNNKYELDGRDPNGFTGVAWCFGKHDRPWANHPIFGNVRYMSANGLRRKFDAERYALKYGLDNSQPQSPPETDAENDVQD